jgi:hypothetical protein
MGHSGKRKIVRRRHVYYDVAAMVGDDFHHAGLAVDYLDQEIADISEENTGVTLDTA